VSAFNLSHLLTTSTRLEQIFEHLRHPSTPNSSATPGERLYSSEPAEANAWPAMEHSLLNKLPSEIKNHINALALAQSRPVYVTHNSAFSTRDHYDPTVDLNDTGENADNHMRALTLTCKSLRSDTKKLFYAVNSFVIQLHSRVTSSSRRRFDPPKKRLGDREDTHELLHLFLASLTNTNINHLGSLRVVWPIYSEARTDYTGRSVQKDLLACIVSTLAEPKEQVNGPVMFSMELECFMELHISKSVRYADVCFDELRLAQCCGKSVDNLADAIHMRATDGSAHFARQMQSMLRRWQRLLNKSGHEAAT